MQMILTFRQEDVKRFGYLLTGLQLLEDDYLGGNGCGAMGVQFKGLEIAVKTVAYYGKEEPKVFIMEIYLFPMKEIVFEQLEKSWRSKVNESL